MRQLWLKVKKENITKIKYNFASMCAKQLKQPWQIKYGNVRVAQKTCHSSLSGLSQFHNWSFLLPGFGSKTWILGACSVLWIKIAARNSNIILFYLRDISLFVNNPAVPSSMHYIFSLSIYIWPVSGKLKCTPLHLFTKGTLLTVPSTSHSHFKSPTHKILRYCPFLDFINITTLVLEFQIKSVQTNETFLVW